MIPVIKVPMGEGEIAILTSTISAAMPNRSKPELTDVYTDTFTEGVTVDVPLRDFVKVWLTCLCCDLEELEGEMEYIITDTSTELH